MALGDKQVLNPSVAAGASDYLIPGAVSLQLKAVQALFTDNGAGGDWLPAVVAISDSGHVFWRACDQGVKVTAGADAEVSWFPGVKHAAASATAAGLDMCIAATTSPYTIPATGGAMTSAVTWNDVRPLTGAFTWPVGGDATKISMPSGIYLAHFELAPVAAWVNTSFVVAQPNWVASGTGFLSQAFFLTTNTSALFAGVSNRPIIGTEGINLQVTDPVQLLTGSSNAAGTAMARISMLLTRLGDSVAGTVV